MAKPSARGEVSREQEIHAEGVTQAAASMPTIPEDVCGPDVGMPTRHPNRHPEDAWAAWRKLHRIKRAVPENDVRVVAPAVSQDGKTASSQPSDNFSTETLSTATPAEALSTPAEVGGPRSTTGEAGFAAVLAHLCSEDDAAPASESQKP